MRKSGFYEHLLNSEITPRQIISIIKERFGNIDLPHNGYLCGQAVASAFFEMANIHISPVYNDIDIFYPVSSSLFHESEHFQRIREIQEERIAAKARWTESFLEYYNGYEHMNGGEYVFREITKYKVLHSMKMGPLNKTYIERVFDNTDIVCKNLKTLMLMDVIENFDINATQIGIDLASGKLFYTKNFLQFLETKQLEIVKYNTPVHSLIRLAKKHSELKGTYVDFAEEKLLVMAYSGSMKRVSEAINTALNRMSESTKSERGLFKGFLNKVIGYMDTDLLYFHEIDFFRNVPIFFG